MISCCLNPYSIGIWSATKAEKHVDKIQVSLNPYSIGIWSATYMRKAKEVHLYWVLILILLEYGLRRDLLDDDDQPLLVLILILLEYGLRRIQYQLDTEEEEES